MQPDVELYRVHRAEISKSATPVQAGDHEPVVQTKEGQRSSSLDLLVCCIAKGSSTNHNRVHAATYLSSC